MREVLSKDICTGCSACMNICPHKCITMKNDNDGFVYPEVDEKVCVNCGLCRRICPVNNFINIQTQDFPIAYAAYNNDSDVVEHSSSGGIFNAFAKEVINQNGIVYGAAFNSDFGVEHIRVTTIEQLKLFRGSKYVQSNINNTYELAKSDLINGKKVLFSETPCQIAGFKQFIDKEYDNLLCIDIICHSVPSPKAWRTYLSQLEDKENQHITNVNFRDKRSSWKKYYLCLELENGREILHTGNDNRFMQAFIQGLSTRESCYKCAFKGSNRGSDITLGDFWGVESVCPESFNERGTSLVIIQTSKGLQAFSDISNQLKTCVVDKDDAIKYNPAYSEPSVPNKYRKDFFSRLESEPFEILVDSLLPKIENRRSIKTRVHSILSRIHSKLNRMLNRT